MNERRRWVLIQTNMDAFKPKHHRRLFVQRTGGWSGATVTTKVW